MVPVICPCTASYTLIVLSSEAVSSSWESGEKASDRIGAECAAKRGDGRVMKQGIPNKCKVHSKEREEIDAYSA